MILHLFPKTQFTEDYIVFIHNHFEADNHRFILYSNEKYDLSDDIYLNSDVFDYDTKNLMWLYNQMMNAEAIVLHNLGLPFRELLLFSFNKKIIKKSVWMIWGADLYCHRSIGDSWGEQLIESARKRIIANLIWTATLTDGDYSLLCSWYRCNSQNYRLEYMSERAVSQMKSKIGEERKKGPTRILVGNSATRSNCHIEAFHMLEKFSNEHIQVITPLSYGDMGYAQEVISEGRRIFGNAFIPMQEFIPKEEYYDFLYSIDVGVFNNDRQEATGNIQALLFYKRKVFIRRDTSLWTEWNEKEGYSIENVADIEGMDFETFKTADTASLENNYRKVYEYYDADARANEWQTLFDDICKA